MEITTTSQHEDQDYTTIGVASARGLLWECAQDIEGARKDSRGFHFPLENGQHLTARIADRSDRGFRGYKHGLIAYTHDGDGIPRDGHYTDRDRPCFYETRGSFEPQKLKEALGEAIDWGYGQAS